MLWCLQCDQRQTHGASAIANAYVFLMHLCFGVSNVTRDKHMEQVQLLVLTCCRHICALVCAMCPETNTWIKCNCMCLGVALGCRSKQNLKGIEESNVACLVGVESTMEELATH